MSGTIAGRANFLTTQFLLAQRGFQVQTVIDVGAAEGIYFLGLRHAGLFQTARHFFVDAMVENEEIYRRIGAKFATGYEITALSCMEGEVAMRIDPDFYNTHIGGVQPAGKYEKTRRVPVSTMDSLVARHKLRAPFMIKLDVQGAELDVLRGALATLQEAVIVTAEIQIFPERDGLVELLALMNGNGWALLDLTDLAYGPADGTFYQCYATFIPKSMDFRAGWTWCLPEQEAGILEQLRERRAFNIRAIETLLGE